MIAVTNTYLGVGVAGTIVFESSQRLLSLFNLIYESPYPRPQGSIFGTAALVNDQEPMVVSEVHTVAHCHVRKG